ncbi:uncharacterized protein LOC112527033 isoform X1 [Cynara cardunculus var. scolymus]|uniref:uncharacterized protein LOC112527033 isoform X1 n=1 Tax=Cynara cardunculus var. scolymus TaxID=59895 RepID=UPI000D62AC77|nr:uncharacterized protein LOC112527033 isoform X1 [Cynara cardunculus var. scolymus]
MLSHPNTITHPRSHSLRQMYVLINWNHWQAEKELQFNKSRTLALKLSGIRYIEQRCLKLDHKVSQFIISSLKSLLDRLDSVYLHQIQQFRVLKSEVENLEELEREKDKYFALKVRDVDEFRARSEIFVAQCQRRVEELRDCVNEVHTSIDHSVSSIRVSSNFNAVLGIQILLI